MNKFTIGTKRIYSGLDIFDIEDGDTPKGAIPSGGEVDYKVYAGCSTVLGSVVLAGADEKMNGGYSLAILFSKFCETEHIEEALFSEKISGNKYCIIACKRGIPLIDTEVDAELLSEYINDIHNNTLPSMIQFGAQGQTLTVEKLALICDTHKKVGLLAWKTLPPKIILLLAGVFAGFASVAFVIWNTHKESVRKENAMLMEMSAAAQITQSPKQLFEEAQKSYFLKSKHCSKPSTLTDFQRLIAIPEKIGGFEIRDIALNCEEGKIIVNYSPEEKKVGIYLFFLQNAQDMIKNNWHFAASTSLNEIRGTLNATKEEINISGGHPIAFKELPLFSDWIIERGSWLQMINKTVEIKATISPPAILVKKTSETELYGLGGGAFTVEGDIIYAKDIIEKTPEILVRKLSLLDNGKRFKIEGDYYVRM